VFDSGAIRWMLIGVASKPEVAAKVLQETASELDSKGIPLKTSLSDWKYVNCVITESLRLWPSFPVGMGETLEAISIGGAELPVGTAMYTSIYGIQRREEFFSHAEEFHPER
jgi:cytochrome P450